MRIGFITCVRLGESCLEELATLGANIVYLGTIHDEIAPHKSGRIYLDGFAAEHDVPLHKFRNMNDPEALDDIRSAALDWLYVIGWSQMAKCEILAIPRLGVVGIHPTLLPVGRGRASIPWAIIKGLDETGVTMFKLDEGMDTGPVLGQVVVPVDADETSTTLYEKVTNAHRTLIQQTYPGIADGTVQMFVQDESKATVWPGRKPSDGRIDPMNMSADEVDRHVRALTHPYPGAFVDLGAGNQVRIFAGSTDPTAVGVQFDTLDGVYTATDFEVEGHS